MRALHIGFAFALSATVAFAQGPGPATLQINLAEAEKLAVQNNPQFTSAKFIAGAAYQVPKEFSAGFQPSFTGTFTGVGADNGSRLAAGGLNNPIVYSRLGSGLALNQLITDFGRTSNLVESAKLRAQAQDQVAETTRAQILLATDRAYFGLLRAQALLKVAQQTVDARQLITDQVSALAQAQLKSQLDVSFANVNLSDARLLLASALNGVQAAEAELATAMGLPNQKGFLLTDEPMPGPLPDQIDPLLREALQKRPELANLRLEQNAAERFVKAERALSFPSVGLAASAGFVPAGPQAVPGQFGAAGLNVTIPVFNGGLFKARRTEAELKARAAASNVNDLANRVARDVRVTYLNAATAYERVGLTAQLLQQAQLALDLAQSRYDLGLSSIVELSQAQLSLTSAQISSTSAKYDYQAQRSLLAYQIGDLR
jgi:outer membrane protein